MNEEALRREVIETALEMSRSGLSPGRSGNVSVRCESGFLITPSGVAYDKMGPREIVFVDEEEGRAHHDRLAPSSEWRFHHDIYARFEEAGAIVHCHSRYATALACDNREIPPFHYMVAVAGGQKIPIAPYALFGTQALSDHIVDTLARGYRACLMEHHGLVAYGETAEAALELAREIEELAAQYVLVLGLGGQRELSEQQMDKVVARFATYGRPAKEVDR